MRGPTTVWTHEDVALVLIDFQKEMFENVRSETPDPLIELNVKFLIRIAKAFDIPIVFSTVGVDIGVNGPTRPSIQAELPDGKPIDRTSMNAWRDKAFHGAVQKTGKKRIIYAALWTEICLTYPVLESMKDGYEAMFVVDAVGGRSQIAHRTAIDRMIAAGAIANTSMAVVTELFLDWASPLAEKARPALNWYLGEYAKLADAKS